MNILDQVREYLLQRVAAMYVEEVPPGHEVRLVFRDGEVIVVGSYPSQTTAGQVIELLKPLVREARRKGHRK